MKNLLKIIVLSVLALGALGCGKLKVPSPKVNWKPSPESRSSFKCSLANETNRIGREFEADYDIKFYHGTILAVIDDLKSKKSPSAKNFWAELSPEVRIALNYELNMYLLNHPVSDPFSVYQSTAHFFNEVKESFNEKANYKIKDGDGKIFTFKARGMQTNSLHMFNYECGKFKTTDVSGYKVGEEVDLVENIVSAFECRTIDKSLMLLEMKENLYVMAGKNLQVASTKNLVKKENTRKTVLALQAESMSFEIRIKNKRAEVINNWAAKKAEINFFSQDYDIEDQGACQRLK